MVLCDYVIIGGVLSEMLVVTMQVKLNNLRNL